MLKSLDKRASVFAIGIREKLKYEPLRALECLLIKIPSLYMHDGIAVKMKTFWGGELVGLFPDGVSSYIYLNEFFEEDLTRNVLNHLEEGMTFIDIGAHIGYFSALASEIVGPEGEVHSFEPTRQIFNILKENAKTRPNIRVNNLAVFSKRTDMEFKDYELRYSAFNTYATQSKLKVNGRASYKNVRVNAIPLDDYVLDNRISPDFIKIDAESAEWEILKGMEKTIEKFKPIISMEVGESVSGAVSSHDCILHLVKKGYTPFCYENGILKPQKIKSEYSYDNILFIKK
jgi:FkbM family methyltransferase